MNIEEYRIYCLSKPGTEEALPFDETTLVFKVMGKIFVITPLENEAFTINLKCDPDRAIELREKHPAIRPGYHMNKKHWNTIEVDGTLSDELLKEMTDHSYAMVVKGLRKIDKKTLNQLGYDI